MNLWIRSQDRKELRPNPKFGIEILDDSCYIVDRYTFDNAFLLGTYKTEERALEVLDEIQEFIECREKSNIELNIDGINQTITYPKRTYKMPKE